MIGEEQYNDRLGSGKLYTCIYENWNTMLGDVTDASCLCSIVPSSLHEDHEQDKEEKRKKAAFVQELIMSTIF